MKRGFGGDAPWYIYPMVFQSLFFMSLDLVETCNLLTTFPTIAAGLVHKQLEGCEDIWLDDEARVLYAACSGTVARTQWNQGYALHVQFVFE